MAAEAKFIEVWAHAKVGQVLIEVQHNTPGGRAAAEQTAKRAMYSADVDSVEVVPSDRIAQGVNAAWR